MLIPDYPRIFFNFDPSEGQGLHIPGNVPVAFSLVDGRATVGRKRKKQ
jgi:hypothetical protein